MRRGTRKWSAFWLALVLVIQTGCGAAGTSQSTEAGESQTAGESQEQESQAEAELAPGSTIAGFTVEAVEENGILQSDVITFSHEKSGARLAYIRNDDPELAFGIFYDTPVVDETDTNHIFEHAIIASSEKYPSSDLFFDLANKSYNTFINAFTYDTFTGYPLSTESEDQLLLLMDAYLSCMTAPGILTDENIFRREALRYELYSPEDPISMTGTVYSEDFGSLTDVNSEALNNVADALYPGQTAANSIGRAHRNYQNLTYENTVATYDRCYHFDNSLILLYGDMDYERMLTFIDEEYLSKAEKEGTDLSAYKEAQTEPGYAEAVVPCPAYEGDTSENVSRIDYAISLEDADWEELLAWNILTTALNQENAVLMKTLREKGIHNPCEVGVNIYCQKPYLLFAMYQAEEEQMESFKEAVLEALGVLAEQGVEREVLASVLKQTETSTYLTRNSANVGVNVFPAMANYWTHTGNVDFYGLYEDVLAAAEADGEQTFVKELAQKALNPSRSALVATVPTPGLAEEIIAEQDAYLAQMKESMSEEEIEELIRQTEEFNTWNEGGQTNSDFVIDPSQIPDAEAYDDFTRSEEDGIVFYEAPAQVEKVGSYELYFDASALTNEDLLYMQLYRLLLGEVGTEAHTEEEIRTLTGEYLYSMSFSDRYPGEEAGENHHPMLHVSWTTLTEDYDTGLNLVLEMLTSTDVSDSASILELVNRYKDSFDLSRTSDFLGLAQRLSRSYIEDEAAYQMTCQGQEYYRFLEEVQAGLSGDEAYGESLAARLAEVRDKLFTRSRLIFSYAAPQESLAAIRQASAEGLSALPEGTAADPALLLSEEPQRLGAAVESPNQYAVASSSLYGQEDFAGRYIPFLTAASDRYVTPLIRFQMGAYSAGASFNMLKGQMLLYSYSDPNVGETLEVFDGLGEALAGLELTQEDLNGYILNSISNTARTKGVLAQPLTAVRAAIYGYNAQREAQAINDMKNASLEDQQAAADCLQRIIRSGGFATVGNEDALRAEAEAFDQVISYRSGEQS